MHAPAIRTLSLAAAASSAALAVLAGARGAPAQSAPPWSRPRDVVELRDGTRLEGEALDVRLGDQLTLRLPSGALRVLLWSELRAAQGVAFTPAVLRVASVQPPAPPPPAAGGDRAARELDEESARGPARFLTPRPNTVPVELVSNGEPLRISVVGSHRAVAEVFDTTETVRVGGEFALDQPAAAMHDPIELGPMTEYVCTTPCTVHLRPGRATLHIGGPGRVDSVQSIDVGGRGERVVLHSASAVAFGGGVVLTLFGGSLALVGGLALLLDATGATPSAGAPLGLVGGVLLGVGAAGLAAGIPILVGARTGVERIEPAAPRAPTSAGPATGTHTLPPRRATAQAAPVRWLGGGIAPDARGGAVAALALAF